MGVNLTPATDTIFVFISNMGWDSIFTTIYTPYIHHIQTTTATIQGKVII